MRESDVDRWKLIRRELELRVVTEVNTFAIFCGDFLNVFLRF